MTAPETTASPPGEQNPKGVETKQTFRKQVWEYLEKNRLANFPRPAYGRIPNYKGADLAAAKLLELDEFKSATCIEVNPDKSLENSRIIVLQNEKSLYVPIPRLKEGLLKKLSLPQDDGDNNVNLKQIVSRWGIEHKGEAVGLDDQVHIDLFVVGSVAVSKQGHRIGKGKGYADLEYAILKEMKAVDDSTVIVTTVHDCQVFDELPHELFENYDVPVDYILTPTQIIKVEKKLARPPGIFWNVVSQRRVNLMQVLQTLKEKHISEGKEVVLKEIDSDVENGPRRRFNNRPRRFLKRRPKTTATKENTPPKSEESKSTSSKSRSKGRYFHRSKSAKPPTSPTTTTENEETTKSNSNDRRNAVGPRRSKYHIDFSLRVSNIEKNVRVRDLKNALNENGIKPDYITWRGMRGFCFLHYAKPSSKKMKQLQEQQQQAGDQKRALDPFGVDNVIDILQKLKIGTETESNLSVKVVEPITRIETTDVTAV